MEAAVPYAYLNDYVDTIEAMPSELVRHFSRLDEVCAKGIGKMESLAERVIGFMNMLDEEAAARSTADTAALKAFKDAEYLKKRTALLESILQASQANLSFIKDKTTAASDACVTAKQLVEKLNDNLQHFEDEQENTWRITQGAYGESLQMAAAAQLNGARNEVAETYNQAPAAALLSSGKARPTANDASKSAKKVDATPSKKRKHGNGKESPPPGRAGTPNNRKEKVSTAVAPSKPNPAAPNGAANASVSLKRKESSQSARGKGDSVSDVNVDPNEPTYCYCNQVSYGEMVACDNDSCPREWFHLPCVGLTAPPKGKWYCKECAATVKRRR